MFSVKLPELVHDPRCGKGQNSRTHLGHVKVVGISFKEGAHEEIIVEKNKANVA